MSYFGTTEATANQHHLIIVFILLNVKSFYVICWYRPPTNEIDISIFEKIWDIINELEQDEKEIVIVGDTNCDFKNMSDGNLKQLQQIYSEYIS